MKRPHDPRLEDFAITITLAGLFIIFAGPCALYKSVEGAPEHYLALRKEQYLKRILLFLALALCLYGVSLLFPSFLEIVIFNLGHLKIKIDPIIRWGILNCALTGILFPTVPLWMKLIRRKNKQNYGLY